MKTSLPLLLLILLTSCSHSPKYVAWKPVPESEAQPAAGNREAATPETATTPTDETAAAESSASVLTNAVVGLMTPVSAPTDAAGANLAATNLALAQQASPPPRQTLPPQFRPGVSSPARIVVDASNAAPPSVMGAPGAPVAPATVAAPAAAPAEPMIPAGVIKFKAAPLEQVLEIYAKYRNKTLLFPATLNLQSQITLINQTDLTRSEVIEALNGVLALNGISVVDMDDKFAKVVAQGEVQPTVPPPDTTDPSKLPSIGQYITRIVPLKYVRPTEMAQVLAPFAKIPGSIYPVESSQLLVLRDYTENIKRMMEMIERVDIAVPSEFYFEVIPIKYALSSEIAEALGSLSGGGGAVSIGGGQRPGAGATTRTGFGGFNRAGGQGGYSPIGGTQFGQPNVPGGVPGAGGPAPGSFQDRLSSIVRRAAGGASGGLQIIGENKIINDDRSNSLLIYASRPDMEIITNIIAKLDVVLAQVIIDSIIMDVQIGNAHAVGVSGLQRHNEFTKNLTGAGGYNNGQPLFDLANFLIGLANGQATNTFFPGSLGGGLTYWAQIGKSYDLVLQAAATDQRINVIQKPRILTTHAKPGQIFVGSTVPYVTSTSYGGAYGYSGNSYQQLQVGIGLSVTPFINSEGLVVMQIHEEISEISGSTAIQGVGDVPNTTTRQLEGEISVHDGDAVMLGGFIRNSTDKKISGVPILKDIPLLGPLFGNTSKSKARQELMVLMRPTVLRTPDIAAATTSEEKQKMPGVLNAEFEAKDDQQKMLEKERKEERIREKRMTPSERKAQAESANQPPE